MAALFFAVGSAPISFAASNSAPSLTGTASPSVSEDTESNIDLSPLSFSDLDDDSLTVTFELSEGGFSVLVIDSYSLNHKKSAKK